MGAAIAAALIGAAGAVGGGLLASRSSGGAAANGRVPDAAEYEPVDYAKQQLAAILGNQAALPSIANLIYGTNDIISKSWNKRAKKFIPGFKGMMRQYGEAGTDLLGGNLPFEDVLGIAANSNELGASLGVPGGRLPGTLRDIGVSKLGAIQAGGGILKDMVNIAGAVAPTSSYANPTSMFLSPTDQVNWEIQQQQLIQQSNQNANNLAAAADPAAAFQQQLQLSQAGQIQGAGQSLLGAGFGMFGGQGATNAYGAPGTNPAGEAQYRMGAVPRAQPAYYNGVIA